MSILIFSFVTYLLMIIIVNLLNEYRALAMIVRFSFFAIVAVVLLLVVLHRYYGIGIDIDLKTPLLKYELNDETPIHIFFGSVLGLIILTWWIFAMTRRAYRRSSYRNDKRTDRGPGVIASLRVYDILRRNERGKKFYHPFSWWSFLFVKCYKSLSHGIRHIADYEGRSTRSELVWLLRSSFMVEFFAFVITLIVVWAGDLHIRIVALPLPLFVLAVTALLTIIPIVACMVRRSHDADRSGWWLLCPFFNLQVLLAPSVLIPGVSADGRRVIVETIAPVIGEQGDEYIQIGLTCAIKSQQIILNQFGVKVSERECVECAASRGWYFSRTDPNAGPTRDNIGNLLEHYGVAIRRYEHATINDLMRELTGGHLVIVCVDSWELYMDRWIRDIEEVIQPNHSIIVNGIDVTDRDNKVAYITDSGVGVHNYACPLDNFLDAWQDSEGFMLATLKPVPGWGSGQGVEPYRFNLDEYPYSLVRPKESNNEDSGI